MPERKAFARSNDNSKFYNSWPWRKLRKKFITANPLCKKCLENDVTTSAKFVDHIVRIEDGGSKLSEENLQSLCQYHHNQKSGREAHGYKESPGGMG